jgi:hypothetical protein
MSQFAVATDCDTLLFQQTTKPNWATAIGRDRFGLWAEFEIEARIEPALKQQPMLAS